MYRNLLIITLFLLSCTKEEPLHYKKVLLLDFDGWTGTTSWNDGYLTVEGANLSAESEAFILAYVSSAFKEYDIKVTTSEAVYYGADESTRQRVVFTKDSKWYGVEAGGTSYQDSFSWGTDTPCFVFTENLKNRKNEAIAAVHETGHTMGLRHHSEWQNGKKLGEYEKQRGDTASFMAVAYNAKYAVFRKGTDPYGQQQNDPLILSNLLGRR